MFKKINEDTLTIIIASMIQFTVTFVGNMLSISLSEISNEFNVSFELINYVSISFFIALVAISIPLAKIISQYGIKKYTQISLIILIIGLIISAFSPNIYILILSRIIQGISISILLVTIYMLIVEQIEDEHMGYALGIVSSCGYIAMTSAPTIAGFIVEIFSWRIMFLMIVPVCIIELLLLTQLKKEWKTEKHPIDKLGSFLYALIMISLTIGILDLDEGGIGLIIIASATFVIFIMHEKNIKYPIYNINLLKNIGYDIGNYAAMVTYFITHIITYILTIYLLIVLQLNTTTAGLILLITPVIMVIISPFSGKLSDKYDSRVLAGTASAILLLTTIILVFIEDLPLPILIFAMVLQGIGHGLFSPSNNKYVLTAVNDDDLSDASALLTTIKEFGKTLSLGIFTLISSVAFSGKSMNEDIPLFLASSRSTITISIILTMSMTILLFYSKYRYEEIPNIDILNFLKSIYRRKN